MLCQLAKASGYGFCSFLEGSCSFKRHGQGSMPGLGCGLGSACLQLAAPGAWQPTSSAAQPALGFVALAWPKGTSQLEQAAMPKGLVG